MSKTKTTTPTLEPEVRENRYLRSARVLLAEGCGLPIAELAVKANMSEATANHCLEAYKGVTEALRDAKLTATRQEAIRSAGEGTGAGPGELTLPKGVAQRPP